VRIELYDRKQTKFISAHNTPLVCLCLSRDGKRLATASDKGTLVRVWSTADGQLLQVSGAGSATKTSKGRHNSMHGLAAAENLRHVDCAGMVCGACCSCRQSLVLVSGKQVLFARNGCCSIIQSHTCEAAAAAAR
jgi:WD40 repeat protein